MMAETMFYDGQPHTWLGLGYKGEITSYRHELVMYAREYVDTSKDIAILRRALVGFTGFILTSGHMITYSHNYGASVIARHTHYQYLNRIGYAICLAAPGIDLDIIGIR